MANIGTQKIKKIAARALEIREKAGYTTEIINKKRYNMPYIPDAVKRAAKELKTPGTAPAKRTKRTVKTAGLKKRAAKQAETPTPAKRTKRIIKTKAFSRKLPRTKPDEINYETARRAYLAISFDPEKRAVSAQKEFTEELNTFAQELEKAIKTKDQYQVAKSEFERYKTGYKAKYLHWLAAMSRTMSSMITGPAKFPVARNQKALNREDAARKNLIDYEKYKAKIIAKIKNAATP